MRPQILFPYFADVGTLKGVGPNAHKALQRLLVKEDAQDARPAIPILRDLLFHLPVGVIDRRFSPPLCEAPDGAVITAVVTVESHAPPPRRATGRPYRVYCTGEGGDITLAFFHAHTDYLTKALPIGQQRVISGRVEHYDGMLQMPHPDFIAPLSDLENVKKLEPVYRLTAGITNRQLAKLMQVALAKVPQLAEWVLPALLKEKSWGEMKAALTAAHHPALPENLMPSQTARQRLAYDEILANQLALALLRARSKKQQGQVMKAGMLRETLLTQLPYALTEGQQSVLAEIDKDVGSGDRMIRLLQGDVGSGKTVVALLAMLSAVEAGLQAAFMVPTEILGQQHIRFIATYAEALGIKVALLTSALKGKQRTETLQAIAAGEVNIVIGTHALFQDEVEFKNLAMVVIDEQHRFGVEQRLAISEKGNAPHLLLMTATPIPRSLAMTAFGDMDSSVLSEKPAGRQLIDTRAIPSARLAEVVEGIKRAIAQGNKVYWICPLIEESVSEESALMLKQDLAAAEARHRQFLKVFGDRVGLVHGRMKASEREKVMKGFAGAEYDILVATTVVEVGVDVPDATVMVIEHAERFGLAQLHQLRGRVGRGEKQSHCLLLYAEPLGEIAKERLRIIRESNDGFRIAEEDLRLRGSGDVLGVKQSGLPDFYFVDFAAHHGLVLAARDDAKTIVEKDASLKTPRGEALRVLLYLYGYESSVRYVEG